MYIVVNTPVCVIYVRHQGGLFMYNIGEVMLFTAFMRTLWVKEIVFLTIVLLVCLYK